MSDFLEINQKQYEEFIKRIENEEGYLIQEMSATRYGRLAAKHFVDQGNDIFLVNQLDWEYYQADDF